nr:glycoside hydrolase family 5 subfamily 2 [Anisarthron barbipes]
MSSPFVWIYLVVIVTNSINIISSKDAALETVSKHGRLHVEGVHLMDEHNERVQLKGMSLFWSVWMSQFYNQESVDGIKKYCHSNIVRPVMAVDTNDGGYLTDPDYEQGLVEAVIEAAIKDDIYVLIDWQDMEAEKHLKESIEFHDKISRKYGAYPNIIYEPYNEPISLNWTGVVKPYHEAIIKTIRANDPNNLIVLGTPWYSQRLDLAAEDPITGYDNIMYSLHYYAGTHQEYEREITKAAIDGGLPVFVSEYGTVNSDATGPVNLTESRLWWDFLEERGMSYVNWSIADKDEAASALIPGTTPDHVCQEEYLTESGRLVVEQNKS